MDGTRCDKVACPWCGVEHDAYTGITGDTPQPGDAAICFDCAGIAVYEDGLRQRRPTEEEAAQFTQDSVITDMVDEIRAFRSDANHP